MLLIQIELRLQLIRNMLKAEYNNSATFSKSITMIKEDDVMLSHSHKIY